ncbi:RTA1 like protein-domain-containing protein, partial [Auriculariales sp. MPI-PUGE-AT-0066]
NYSYDASIPAALMFAAIFAMSLAVHIWQAARYKTTWVWGLIFGILFEVVGFITRYIAIKKLHTIWPLLVSETSLISAPAVLAAYLYMLAGRLMSYLGGHYSPVRHQLITKIFVVADFFSISAQALGGSMLAAKTLERLQLGFNILVVALAVQIVILVVFIGIVIVFDIRSRRGLREQRQPVQPLFYVFYVGSGMILLRSIYRLIDFGTIKFTADGVHGYTLTHEWLMYTFDAVPMTICVVVFNWVHAGRFLPAKKGLRIDGSQEAQSATNWLWPLKR